MLREGRILRGRGLAQERGGDDKGTTTGRAAAEAAEAGAFSCSPGGGGAGEQRVAC